jgi:hypothetical protein
VCGGGLQKNSPQDLVVAKKNHRDFEMFHMDGTTTMIFLIPKDILPENPI